MTLIMQSIEGLPETPEPASLDHTAERTDCRCIALHSVKVMEGSEEDMLADLEEVTRAMDRIS